MTKKKTQRMATWKAISLDVLILAVMCGVVALILRPWLRQQEQKRWPTVTGTVTDYKQGPGFKGRPATYLQGHYLYGGVAQTFRLAWGYCDLTSSGNGLRHWVPPAGVPSLGSTITLRVNPAHPAHVALDEGPLKLSTLWTFSAIAVVALVFVGSGIFVWFY